MKTQGVCPLLPEDDTPRNDAARMIRKWGPFSAIMAAIALVGVLVLVNEPSDTEQVASPGAGGESAGAGGDGEPGIGAPDPVGQMPLTYAEAEEEGTVDDYDWGDNCDTERGTIKLPSVYAAPCVPVWEGDNGGDTSTGVTGDSIRVVWYDASESGGLDSLLGDAGLKDTSEQQYATIQDWSELYASVSETYGREVELVRYAATGAFDDAVAAQADAELISQDIQPFAVLGGPPSDGGAFADELARNGIICIGCALGMPECKMRENAPYSWGNSPAVSHFIDGLTAWATPSEGHTGLVGNAEYAGDPALQAQERKFGVIHFEQDPPVMTVCPGPSAWGEDWLVETYLLDFATMPQVGTELVAKMKTAGVTSIFFGGDPLMPIYLTNAAESLDYHPEWIFTGTVLTDTNSFARLYNQDQMRQAFGVSQTGVPVNSDNGGALALYRWYFGADAFPDARAGYAVLNANIPRLYRGIQLAGPDLTPETFELAMFRIPPLGGDPVFPQQSHGRWGYFPEVDYNGTDDLAEIWWDADAEGLDETDKPGKGMWRYARGGARFTPDNPPEPAPFVEEDTVTRFEELPEESRGGTYPPPAGSPAASS